MQIETIPTSFSWPALAFAGLFLLSMGWAGFSRLSGARKRTAVLALAAFAVSGSLMAWSASSHADQLEAFDAKTAAHYEDEYGYRLTDPNAEQLRLAGGSDAVLYVMTGDGSVREVLFRTVDGTAVPFLDDSSGGWSAAAGS